MKNETVNITKNNLSQYIAEGIGVFFLVLFGCGSIVLSQINPNLLNNNAIPFVFGFIVMIMIYSVGHISGAHFNPAVTISFYFQRKIKLNKAIGYIVFQLVGALLASFLHFLLWSNSGHDFGMTQLSVGILPAIIIEFIISFLLMFVITAVSSDSRAVGELAGLAIGLTVLVCSIVAGPLTGSSMNPARSLAPAIMSGNLNNILIFIFVPIAGAVCGGFIYNKIKCNQDVGADHGCC